MAGFDTPPSSSALSKVAMPAIALLVVGILGMLGALLFLLLGVLGIGAGAAGVGGDDAAAAMGGGLVYLIAGVFGVVLEGVVIFGALKMKKLESYGMAMAAAIIPILCAGCIGIPIGIWALIVLNDAEVKASFR